MLLSKIMMIFSVSSGFSDTLLALIALLIGGSGIGGAGKFAWNAAKQAGRAEAYRESSQQTIAKLRSENQRLHRQLQSHDVPPPPSLPLGKTEEQEP